MLFEALRSSSCITNFPYCHDATLLRPTGSFVPGSAIASIDSPGSRSYTAASQETNR